MYTRIDDPINICIIVLLYYLLFYKIKIIVIFII